MVLRSALRLAFVPDVFDVEAGCIGLMLHIYLRRPGGGAYLCQTECMHRYLLMGGVDKRHSWWRVGIERVKMLGVILEGCSIRFLGCWFAMACVLMIL